MVRTDKMRMTKQRRLILEELRRENSHPTADVIYENVRKKMEILTALGEIQTLELSGSQKRYDGVPNKHYHIRCLHCGRVDDAPIAPLQRLEDELYEATVYTIMGHRLEFMGLCPECSKDKEICESAEAAIASAQAAVS